MDKESGPRLLAVFAHPDDESFGIGGTMARYSAEGVQVHLVCATRGEGGSVGDPPICQQEELGKFREEELRAACEVLGVRSLRFLGCPDGQVETCPRRDLVRHVARAILEIRPQVVVTFGPDGISGHPDHVAIGEITTEAVKVASDPRGFFAEAGEMPQGWAVPKLYQVVRSRSTAACCGEPTTKKDEVAATARIDVSDYVDTKLRAMGCHRSQPQPLAAIPREELRDMLRWELFRLANGDPGELARHEEDLFEGVERASTGDSSKRPGVLR